MSRVTVYEQPDEGEGYISAAGLKIHEDSDCVPVMLPAVN
jgi:hypothetical protein